MKKIVYSILLIYFTARLALFGSGYFLTPDEGFYGGATEAIDSFSAEGRARALEYYRWGFEFRVLSFVISAAYIFICASIFFRRHGERPFGASFEASREGYSSLAADTFRFYAGAALASLPCRFVLGYLRERHFGFFNQGPEGWLALHLKQLAVGLCVLLAVLMLAKAVVSLFREKWHYALSACFPAAGLAGSLLLQAAVIPLFYETAPLADAALSQRLISMASAAGIDAREISVIDESRYSSHTNAFFTGFGPFRRIYLCDTLFGSHDRDEIAAIYAHELGHYVYDHELLGIALSSLAAAALFFGAAAFMRRAGHGPGVAAAHFNRIALLGLILSNAAYFFAMPAENYISRRFERAADAFALETAAGPDYVGKETANGFVAARSRVADAQKRLMVKLCEKNLSVAAPERFNYLFFATHPAPVERVAAAEKFVEKASKVSPSGPRP